MARDRLYKVTFKVPTHEFYTVQVTAKSEPEARAKAEAEATAEEMEYSHGCDSPDFGKATVTDVESIG